MSVDDLLSFASDRRWRRLLTTPLLPLFWLARTTRRGTRALALKLGVQHHSRWLARRLGVRRGVDYGFSHRKLAYMTDDQLLKGPSQPGKAFTDALEAVGTDDRAGWRSYLDLLGFLARSETERLANRGRDALGRLRSRTRASATWLLDALPALDAGGDGA